jgi:hypothetical protein
MDCQRPVPQVLQGQEVSDVVEVRMISAEEFIKDTYVSTYDEKSFIDISTS